MPKVSSDTAWLSRGATGPGIGPIGLVLAAELLARGIDTRVIDKGDGVALQSRAIGIHARTLEVLDMMGLAERFVDRGQVVRQLNFYSEGDAWSAWSSRAAAHGSASGSTSRRTRPSCCFVPGSPNWAAW